MKNEKFWVQALEKICYDKEVRSCKLRATVAMVSDNNDELQKEVTKLSDKIEILTNKIEEMNNNYKN